MNIRAICFTQYGKQILERISTNEEINIKCFIKSEQEWAKETIEQIENSTLFAKVDSTLEDWTREAFDSESAVVFVGALGIAIRAVSKFVSDKLTDSPLVVIDDKGQYVIPVLSGHIGGANELALMLAEKLSALPVITTSTDSGDAFAVDLWAKENNLQIVDRDNIKKVSAKSIEGRSISLSIKDYPPKQKVDVIVTDEIQYPATITLAPKKYVVGMGLKRGKSLESLEKAFNMVISEASIDINQIGAIATIDIKLDEEGLKKLANKYRLPLIGFEGSILAKASGEFSSSQFVKDTVGVDNVCERAAVVATETGKLIVKKQALDGVTVAIAAKE